MRKSLVVMGVTVFFMFAMWLFISAPSSAALAAVTSNAASGSQLQLTATPSPAATTTLQPTPTVVSAECIPAWFKYDWDPVYAPLMDVAALTYNEAWAIQTDNIYHLEESLWTGAIPFPTPTSAADYTFLTVSAHSHDEAWIGGFYTDLDDTEQPLVMRWDGSAWSLLPMIINEQHTAGGAQFRIYGIAGVADNLAYAVGSGGFGGTLPIFKCTPASCTSEAHPGQSSRLLDVDGTGPDDVWAVGDRIGIDPIVEHFDGSTWTVLTTPDVGSANAVTAVAPNDVWVGGSDGLIHWDGSTWTVYATPSDVLHLTGTASNDVWATIGPDASIWHWDGISWTINNTLPGDPLIVGISAHTPNDVWLITNEFASEFRGYFYHYTPPRQFADMSVGTSFYLYAQLLSCKGIITGYPCGGPGEDCVPPNNLPWFRPVASITRAQLAKIVSLAAGYGPPPTTQTFEDVPIGSTFWVYIENLARYNLATGYPCGGPGEPCVLPHMRPYFRPGATVSRGQTSKIVALARNFNDPPTTQTFEDVPIGSTFYLWIENLARRDIITGYPCGDPGHPCGPKNRPYFLPAGLITRGQAAKIISNSFFP
jgi:hypothetical protein